MQLSAWGTAIDTALDRGEVQTAVALAHLLLRKQPRHLATYERIIHICWTARRWEEGREWGLRLLRGDPSNVLGWGMLALAAEKRGEQGNRGGGQIGLDAAHSLWQRALALDPYNAEVRAGWSRTAISTPPGQGQGDNGPQPVLNQAALAFLQLRAKRWAVALPLFTALARLDNGQVVYSMGHLLSLWRTQKNGPARILAQELTTAHRGMLAGWLVLFHVGDANDRAIAQGYVQSLDPDGEYAIRWLGPASQRADQAINLSEEEQASLDAVLKG